MILVHLIKTYSVFQISLMYYNYLLHKQAEKAAVGASRGCLFQVKKNVWLQSVIKLREISICCTVRETSVVTLSIPDWLEGFLHQASFTQGCFKFLLFKPRWPLMGVRGSFTFIEKKPLQQMHNYWYLMKRKDMSLPGMTLIQMYCL